MAETGAGEARKTGATAFEGVTPILRVGSLAASLEYYVKVLGFKVDWQDPGIAASVSRGRCHIMLCEGDQGHAGGWVWIGVDAIERYLRSIARRVRRCGMRRRIIRGRMRCRSRISMEMCCGWGRSRRMASPWGNGSTRAGMFG